MTEEAIEFDAERIVAAYDEKFGRGWRTALCRATGIDATQLSRMRGPTVRTLGLLLEWMEETPEIVWPDRFAELRDMWLDRRQRR